MAGFRSGRIAFAVRKRQFLCSFCVFFLSLLFLFPLPRTPLALSTTPEPTVGNTHVQLVSSSMPQKKRGVQKRKIKDAGRPPSTPLSKPPSSEGPPLSSTRERGKRRNKGESKAKGKLALGSDDEEPNSPEKGPRDDTIKQLIESHVRHVKKLEERAELDPTSDLSRFALSKGFVRTQKATLRKKLVEKLKTLGLGKSQCHDWIKRCHDHKESICAYTSMHSLSASPSLIS